jgi:DnaD/phage-associated family protein
LERSNDKALNGIDAEKRRETPRNAVSLPPPPSLSPSPLKDEEEERARDGEIFKFFNENIGLITPFQAETISKHLDEGMEPGMILDVLTDSLGKTEKWSWINKVLANSSETKTKTLLQFREKKRLLAEARKKPPNRPPGIPQKGNFEQRKYTDEDFESLYKDV